MTGATHEFYARTGYLGFLRRTECSSQNSIKSDEGGRSSGAGGGSRAIDDDSLKSVNNHINSLSIRGGDSSRYPNSSEHDLHDAVYVVGALDEVIILRGLSYHPIDIENSVLRCHKKIAEW